MKRRMAVLTVITALGVVMTSPARLHGQQATEPGDHSAHHPSTPATQTAPPAVPGATGAMTSTAQLDALVKKMNSAKGTAKTEAMAELLTTLAQDRQACEPMMATMMKMMGGPNGSMPMKSPAK